MYQNFQKIQNREKISNEIKAFLKYFHENKSNLLIVRGIYLFGPHGSGKTAFIKDLLNQLGMDSIWYTSSDQRNKAFFENLNKNNISNHSVISLFQKKRSQL